MLVIANNTNAVTTDSVVASIILDKFFIPSGNVERDLDTLKVYYSKFSAKKPENY